MTTETCDSEENIKLKKHLPTTAKTDLIFNLILRIFTTIQHKKNNGENLNLLIKNRSYHKIDLNQMKSYENDTIFTDSPFTMFL